MSGSALGPWALVQNPTHYAHQVARHANCSPDLPHPHLLKCLRDRPLDALLSTPIETPDFTPVFGPSVDGVVIDNEPEPADESGPRYRYVVHPLPPIPDFPRRALSQFRRSRS